MRMKTNNKFVVFFGTIELFTKRINYRNRLICFDFIQQVSPSIGI